MSWDKMANNVMGVCTSTFNTTDSVIHRPKIGEDQIVKGIWSDVYLSVEPETGIQIMSSEPNIGVRLSDFTIQPRKHDLFIKSKEEYRVRAIEPDGEAGAVIVLEKVV